jgi:hypothetical protein
MVVHHPSTMEPKKIPHRNKLSPRDIQKISGRSLRTCQRLIRKIRMAYGEPSLPYVTIKELCRYWKIDQKEIRKFLGL